MFRYWRFLGGGLKETSKGRFSGKNWFVSLSLLRQDCVQLKIKRWCGRAKLKDNNKIKLDK